jgi:AraC-like DNA-binding protein
MTQNGLIDERNNQDGQAIDALRQDLVEVIDRQTVGEENCVTSIKNLFFFRRESLTEPCDCVVEPSIVFVVQGVKQLLVGDMSFVYDTGNILPAKSQVLEASIDSPCLGLMFKLDLRIIAEIIAQSDLPPPRDAAEGGTAIGTMTSSLLEPFARLVALSNEPEAISILAPLIEREIHFRLLKSDLAPRLWKMASTGSQSHRISRAIDWLRNNYTQPLRIDALASHVQMSASTLHHHFRVLTAMSPLQYQKWLRLCEARRLMFNERFDASSAAFQVGYESPSQFSREYGRHFGVSPKRDVEDFRSKVAN